MKKITLFFLLISAVAFGQYVTKAEIVKNEKGGFGINKTIELKNGLNEKVNTELSVYGFYEPALKFDYSKLDSMLNLALIKSQANLRSPSTFRPVKIMAAKFEEKWSIIVNYTGENVYGGTVETESVFDFDNNGEFIKKY